MSSITGAGRAVAFDLDMTLVDSRPPARRALERIIAEGGFEIDVGEAMAAYGLPLATWLPQLSEDQERFRALQLEGIAAVEEMQGAREAVEAVRADGGRAIVVTGSTSAVAQATLAALRIEVDEVHADLWAIGKVGPLQAERCWAYVGDHAEDMAAAREAGAIAVGVATGTTPPLGAEVELADLREFASWFAAQPVPR